MINNDLHDGGTRGAYDLPEDDPSLEPVVRQVAAWAGEEQQLPRIETKQLHAMTRTTAGGTRSRWAVPRAAWVLLAASFLVYCVSMVNVRVEWGNAVLELGQGTPVRHEAAAETEIKALEARFNLQHSAVERNLIALAGQYVALQSELRETATSLINAQNAESATRYNDVCQLIKLTHAP